VNNQWNVGIVAFGFGEPSGANPNANIGVLALQCARRRAGTPIFTDRDVSPHLAGASGIVEEIDPKRIPTTYRLAKMAMERAKEYELNELQVVATTCHMWRCLRDLRWAAHDCGVAVTLTPCPIRGFQYDSSATTPYTRTAWRWWTFEIAYRAASGMFPAWYKRTRA